MAAFRVVVVLDVIADGVARFRSSLKCAAVHELFLEGRKEALSDGIVAVAGSAHAANRAVLEQQVYGQCSQQSSSMRRGALDLPLTVRQCGNRNNAILTWRADVTHRGRV